jgi:Xaa-Pro dipeptidase
VATDLARLHREHVADLLRRYGEVLGREGLDAAVLHSGSLQQKSAFDDQYWPLRIVPHFAHWLPLAEPDCALVVRPGKPPVLVRPKVTSFWERPPKPERDFLFDSFEVVADTKPSLGPGKVAFVGEDRARAAAWGVAEELVAPPRLIRDLDALRTTKTPYELACLEEANRRAAVGHEAVREAFFTGDLSELELHLLYLRATGQDDPETPYKNIVARGANAATLHHVSYERAAKKRPAESLLLDAGATFLGYASDVTRTWVKGATAGAATFGGIVRGVDAMQQRLWHAAKVGLPYEELHEEAHRQVAEILRDAGIVKASAEEAVANGTTRVFFPHGLGHSLGLQTHDVGCATIKPKPENPFLRNTSTIREGQVFTVEPGVYFIEGLLEGLRAAPHASTIDWPLVDALRDLGGVRIEDDVFVLGQGRDPRNLTREALAQHVG